MWNISDAMGQQITGFKFRDVGTVDEYTSSGNGTNTKQALCQSLLTISGHASNSQYFLLVDFKGAIVDQGMSLIVHHLKFFHYYKL